MEGLTLKQLLALDYVGGGYFRQPGPKGRPMPTMHGPALMKELRKMCVQRPTRYKMKQRRKKR